MRRAESRRFMTEATTGVYLDGKGNLLPSFEHLNTARLLQSLALDYRVEERDGHLVFVTEKGVVAPVPDGAPAKASVDRLKRIRIEDASLNFDYAHFLPSSPRCSLLHGHSSKVVVEIAGVPVNGMVVEFGEAKRIIRESLAKLDHKLVVARKYVKQMKNDLQVVFEGKGGTYSFNLPNESVYIMEDESTVEKISEHLAKEMTSRMPSNVEYVSVTVYEGFGKAAESRA